MKQSPRITAHHAEEFGRVSLETLMLKLTEEVGEVNHYEGNTTPNARERGPRNR